MARRYRRSWLVSDIVAGVTLASILVPMDMAYAEVAGLPAIYGLYASIVALLSYALFGPSRILVLGPESAVVALMAAAIVPITANDPGRAVALAGMLAIMTGLFCILAGILRFGFVTDLLSKPIRFGLLNGIAMILVVGQLPKVFGFSIKGESVVAKGEAVVRGIMAGKVNLTSCLIGATCLAAILAFNRYFPRVPGVLVAVVGATATAAIFDLAVKSGIAVVGPLPRGLPAFHLPAVSSGDIGTLFPAAFALAVVAFADMSVLSRTFAARGGYKVDSSQELFALGAANVMCGLFSGFAVSCCASRTPVAEEAGARTQLTGVVSALCIALLLLCAPMLIKDLPEAALGAIVISACIGLSEISGVRRLYRVRRSEFLLSIICFVAVTFVGVSEGIFIAVGLSLLAFIWRAWHPYDAVLGQIHGVDGFHDVSRFGKAWLLPGLVLFRWDAPLFFANADIFHDHLLQAITDVPTDVKCVIVSAEPITDVDTTAADVLSQLHKELRRAGIELCIAEMKDPVRDKLKTYGLYTQIGPDMFFPTVRKAIDWYKNAYQVKEKYPTEPFAPTPPVSTPAKRGKTLSKGGPKVGSKVAGKRRAHP
ncbi:SulP family inorganic anion transporter [Geomonas sp.]|uniref:SulP family inorganic anion transporter n=1 Tax=Geomonas sp. TaxID=2651584 RepID=UPI002B4A5EC4|nr:sulfate permease [Geomonas sp.]